MKYPKQSISAKERVILELLGGGERYGLELVEASAGALKRGTVYVTLARMEAHGLVSSRQEAGPPAQGGLPRRLYRQTALGAELMTLQRSFDAALARVAEAKR